MPFEVSATARVKVGEKFTAVGVATEGVEDFDCRSDPEPIPEDRDFRFPVTNFCPECVRGTVTDKKNRVFRIFDRVAKMV